MWAIAFLITILRLGIRYHHVKRLFWDDAFAISALACLTAVAILNQTSCQAIYMVKLIAAGGTPGLPFTTPEKVTKAIIL
jgi:hypothetical protein